MSNIVAQKSRRASAIPSLYAIRGGRKYLNAAERRRALASVGMLERRQALFLMTLANTGARVSELLALTSNSFQLDQGVVAIVTLKRRRHVVRELPLPPELIDALDQEFGLSEMQCDPSRANSRLWPCHRSTAWRWVKSLMAEAGISGLTACPRGFRHGFGVATLQAGVPLNLVKRWLGHARLSTTEIYADAIGPEERAFAERVWASAVSSRGE